MHVTLYHNPRCSKSRQTLELIESRGIEPEIIEYLQTPPDADTLRTVFRQLGTAPKDAVRKGEAPWADNDLENASDDAVVQAIVEHPILLQRPIVVIADEAVIGRPPEAALDLIDKMSS